MGLGYPSQFRAPGMLLSILGAAEHLKPGPDSHWCEHNGTKARVLCPCRNRPVVGLGELRSCRADAASPHRCHRLFLFTGRGVLVGYGPA